MTADIMIPLAVMAGRDGVSWGCTGCGFPAGYPAYRPHPQCRMLGLCEPGHHGVRRRRHHRARLWSLLQLDYPRLEIIAVNDRSTDTTGAILERLAVDAPHVRVVHIETLPEGWLGKVHAMHSGAEASTGQWILFADADVIFSPDIIRRAVAHAESQDLDHFSLIPKMEPAPLLLDATVTGFVQLLVHKVYGFRAMPFGAGHSTWRDAGCLEASEGLGMAKDGDRGRLKQPWLITEAGGRSAAATALKGSGCAGTPPSAPCSAVSRRTPRSSSAKGDPTACTWRGSQAWRSSAPGSPRCSGRRCGPLWGPGAGSCCSRPHGSSAECRPRYGAALALIGLSLVLTAGLWSMVRFAATTASHGEARDTGGKNLVAGRRVKV